MNPTLIRLILGASIAMVGLISPAQGQQSPARKTGPVTKVYVAEADDGAEIEHGDKIYPAQQSATFDAPGTVIETKAGGHSAIVYSNGTAMYLDENTRVEIDRFVQDPFDAQEDELVDSRYEPSMSQSNIIVPRGILGICTNQLVSGSSMVYMTPQAAINIRGGQVVVAASEDETIVDLIGGDVTVRHFGRELGAQVLRPGERAVIRAPRDGQEPAITVGPIPNDARTSGEERIQRACNARKSVTFSAISRGTANDAGSADEAAGAGGDEVVARPTVPATPPANIVVSPDRLPGT
jgi:hypothetical protein